MPSFMIFSLTRTLSWIGDMTAKGLVICLKCSGIWCNWALTIVCCWGCWGCWGARPPGAQGGGTIPSILNRCMTSGPAQLFGSLPLGWSFCSLLCISSLNCIVLREIDVITDTFDDGQSVVSVKHDACSLTQEGVTLPQPGFEPWPLGLGLDVSLWFCFACCRLFEAFLEPLRLEFLAEELVAILGSLQPS